MNGSEQRPKDENGLSSLNGGVMGEGGCPPRERGSEIGVSRKTFSRVWNIKDTGSKVKKIL
jgi:hypothetical protein